MVVFLIGGLIKKIKYKGVNAKVENVEICERESQVKHLLLFRSKCESLVGFI